MGREQRRKEQFKNKNKKVEENELDVSIKLSTTIKLASFVVILLLVIYYVLAIFVTKELDVSDDTSTIKPEEEISNTNSVSNKILASNIFNQKEEEYYVYFYDFNDENEVVSGVVSNISDKVYRVDTSSSLNSNYVTEDGSNKDATNLDELKVVDPTIIKVKGDKIVEYYEGSSNIYDELN